MVLLLFGILSALGKLNYLSLVYSFLCFLFGLIRLLLGFWTVFVTLCIYHLPV